MKDVTVHKFQQYDDESEAIFTHDEIYDLSPEIYEAIEDGDYMALTKILNTQGRFYVNGAF